LGIASVDAPVGDDAEIERAIDAFAREANGGLVVLPDTTVAHFRDVVVSAVARHRLPAVYPYRYYATSGGLLSYGIDTVDLYLRAASYADRILRGAKTTDLPVQQPTKFELVVNLNIANAIGVGIPPSLLARADEVIE
jgi:putative ABC transport system substrate-binding protein